MRRQRQVFFPYLLLGFLCLPSASPAGEALTLRINDAIGAPGGLVAAVIRTYAPRPVGQGQICLFAPAAPDDGGPVFSELVSGMVFSTSGDAAIELSFEPGADGQVAMLEFTSPSATVNTLDGPMAVLFLRLAADAPVGQELSLELDPGEMFLIGEDGEPIAIEPRAGELTVRAPGDPLLLEADGDSVAPGQTALLSVETLETFPISRGQIRLSYDPAIAAGPPVVTMDERYGAAVFTVDAAPGSLLVAFESPDNTLNEVPGDLLSIALPLAVNLLPGTLSPLTLDATMSFLIDPQDEPLALVFEDGEIEVLAGDTIFADGFESGNLSDWSEF